MLERIFGKKTPSLEERVSKIEILLEGEDKEPESSNWSYVDIREIIDKTDLIPNMSNQELMNIAPSYHRIEALLERLGKTDAHIGPQTLEERLNIIDGCIDILHMSHIGHTNFVDVEFEAMHGFIPSSIGGDIMKRVDGIQKKLDRLSKLFDNTKITMSGKTALEL